MKISTFSVKNFRSLKQVDNINFSDKTVLVGKNNEGKSNFLKAINIAMNILLSPELRVGRRFYSNKLRKNDEVIYNWDRDFPIVKQSQKQGLETTFGIGFKLNDDELIEFKGIIGSSLNGLLSIEITIGPENRSEYKIKNFLGEKKMKVLDFISERISVNYIPAVRTDDEALSVIRRMLSDKLEVLEEKKEYQKALQIIADLQKPLIAQLSEYIRLTLQEFLPSIKDVKVEIEEEVRRVALRKDVNVIIDDGTPTDIKFKGDGIKSLVTLSLLKSSNSIGNEVILIEEPESHLHPEAIHSLVGVINKITEQNQVVIATHNPLFADRKNIKNNIIVNSGKALPAKKLVEIRKILGIKASDNLINASYVLIVEGESDRRALNAILPTLSKDVGKAIKNHDLVIEEIGGAGNLLYKLQTLKSSLCSYHVFFDHDQLAIDKIQESLDKNYLADNEYNCSICSGMKESELEDCFEVGVYKDTIETEFGIQLNIPSFKNNEKWSLRMKKTFENNGKVWKNETEAKLKTVIADCVVADPKKALNEYKRNSIDSLARSLEKLIKPVVQEDL